MKYCQTLPAQTILVKFFPQDRVGFPQSFQTVTGDGTEAAHAQTGAGEGLAVDHAVGQTQRFAYDTHFILEQQLDRLHQLEGHALGQTANIVVGLDAVGLQNVGIDGSLRQKINALQLLRFVVEYLDEFLADDLPLGLGVGDARQLVEKTIDGIHIDEIRVHFVPEDLDDLLRLTLAQKTVVDVDADQLLADGLDQQRGHHAGIHAAGQRQKNLSAAHLRANFFDLLGDKGVGEGGGGDAFHGFGTYIA